MNTKNINKLTIILLGFLTFIGCDDPKEDLFDTYDGEFQYSFFLTDTSIDFCEPTRTFSITASDLSNSDRTVTFSIDSESTALAEEYSISSNSVIIPANSYEGTFDVTVDFSQVPEGAERELILNIEISDDNKYERRTSVINYTSACVLNQVVVDLAFDNWPEEAAYFIEDSSGNIVDGSFNSAGQLAFGVFDNLTSFSKTLCLPDGDYVAVFFDAFGDGNTAGVGSYGLELATCTGSTDLFTPLSASNFGASPPVAIPFSLP